MACGRVLDTGGNPIGWIFVVICNIAEFLTPILPVYQRPDDFCFVRSF
jgi:hypothetical protein